jgi:hypothetical protein
LDFTHIYLRSIGQWASQSLRSYALLEYRVSGACGGTAQPPGWGWHNIRLNRETQDANNIVTLLPNSEFTLAEGTYRINAFVLFHPGSHRAKLCYAGDESVVLLGSNPEVGASNILGQFTLADTTTLKIMDYFPAGGECDFGYSSFDRYTDESIFTQVEIWKI